MLKLWPSTPVSIAAGAVFAMLAVGQFTVPQASAQSMGLSGSWGGGGKIVFPSGESERARCRAHFRSAGRNSYSMSAVCATASTRVHQVANIRRVGGNVYRGDFFNEQHGIAGTVRITLKGSHITASLTGGGGSAVFLLKR
ncbi:MAG: hypothetical protein AB7E81_10890 [Hyphomicrobiaceae bacterium]